MEFLKKSIQNSKKLLFLISALSGLGVKKKNKGTGNTLKNSGIIFKASLDIRGNNNTVTIGDGSIVRDLTVYIRGNGNRIIIGKNVKFNRKNEIWVEDDRGLIEIGDDCSFESVHLALTEDDSKIVIGKDCMFASDIDVRTGDSHSILEKTSGRRINPAADVIIRDHVWIGARCSVLKGVAIPDNCVIATGTILTSKIEKENVIVAGNPGRIVKENINWTRQRIKEAD